MPSSHRIAPVPPYRRAWAGNSNAEPCEPITGLAQLILPTPSTDRIRVPHLLHKLPLHLYQHHPPSLIRNNGRLIARRAHPERGPVPERPEGVCAARLGGRRRGWILGQSGEFCGRGGNVRGVDHFLPLSCWTVIRRPARPDPRQAVPICHAHPIVVP